MQKRSVVQVWQLGEKAVGGIPRLRYLPVHFPGSFLAVKEILGCIWEFARLGNKDVILQGCRFIKDPVYTFFSATTSPGMNSNIWKVVL
jgi:hypothetical protein